MLKITVKKSYVEYLSRFTSKEESRYYLNGLFFDKQDNVLAATDGHRLGYIENGFTADSDMAESGYIVKFNKQALSLLKSFKHAEEFNEFLQKSGVKENVQDVYEQAQQKYDRANISLGDELKDNENIVPAVKIEANVNVLNRRHDV